MLIAEYWVEECHTSDAWVLFRRKEADYEHLHEQGDLFVLNFASKLDSGAANTTTKEGTRHKTRKSH
jgi:hypothetical protein